MSQIIDRDVTDWYLAFRPTQMWYRHVLQPGYGHVAALGYREGVWVYFDPGSDFSDIMLIDGPDLKPEDMLPDHQIVLVEARRRKQIHRWPWIFGPVTCVEAIKSLLGIRNPLIWTPYQLFRYCQARSFILE
jgi:hypothetical protein